jgi:hypothetical protein
MTTSPSSVNSGSGHIAHNSMPPMDVPQSLVRNLLGAYITDDNAPPVASLVSLEQRFIAVLSPLPENPENENRTDSPIRRSPVDLPDRPDFGAPPASPSANTVAPDSPQ